ncbi:M20 family metallopeptidase [Bradyrhizobium sp. CCGUVB14]|uniref:M20 family metallopeptidase n=1 Tax=Bradyrhizobium sp. CCGUVB14 TaxID=2949628 RepID=UPI0020B21F75|nr:M20 family metallopeptidase [Bradyrhizobium sp. CCGUVB14]MCP3441147.1 M20 family metallopeptidase [Bradyrhizobium sp. CCGUVB14]
MLSNEDRVWTIVESKSAAYFDLSDKIWDAPELNYQEFTAASLHADLLKREGFSIKSGVAGMPTAVMGEAGKDGPVIAFLGEYDALPGLSQEAGVARHQPLIVGGPGHGCGHNMLGAAALLAAASIKEWLRTAGLPGRVRYYGCPAEEGGSSKGFMVKEGAFDDVDVAICWHPSAFTGVFRAISLACVDVDFTFHGRASHAAVSPELGRSALDAVELMNIGVNYMREHMPSTARIHYAMIDGGGVAPNVVPAKAIVRHLVRAATLGEMWQLLERVKKIAQGAALMSETIVEIEQLTGDANLVENTVLEEAMQRSLMRLGAPEFDDADRRFAAEIQKTLSREDIAADYARFGLPIRLEPLFDGIYPLDHAVKPYGSTDVGTVSWVIPTVQCNVACFAPGTPFHSWQLVAQGKAPAAHKGIAVAAKAMAGLAKDLFTENGLLSAAKEEFRTFRDANEFRNPIGMEMTPPLEISA